MAFIILTYCNVVVGQQSTITATITDSDSVAWASLNGYNATYSIALVSSVGVPIPQGQATRVDTGAAVTVASSGNLDGTGSLSATLVNSNNIIPSGTQWRFRACPAVSSSPCLTVTQTVNAPGSLSAALSAASVAPRIGGGIGNYAYADVEVAGVANGSYYNITTPALRCFGSLWVACGGNLIDTRPSVITTTGKTGVLTPGGSLQVFNVTGTGTITYLHLTMGPNAIDPSTLMQYSTLTINSDGNPQVVPLSTFFLSQDSPAAFNTDFSAVPASTPFNNASFNRRANINFFTSCTITLNNASAAGQASIYFDTAYRSGTPVSSPAQKYWNAFATPFQSVPANTNGYNFAQVYALPSTTFTGGGQLESIEEYFNSAANYQYMESTPVVTADSIVAAKANGHEDFFSSGYYCNASYATPTSATDNKWGCILSAGLQNPISPFDFLGYRWFTSNPADNLNFTSTLAVSSANGGNNFGSPGTVNWDSLVTYFTAAPTVGEVKLSLAPGTYGGTQSVSLSGGPSGAYICYTTNGTVPVPNGSGGCTTGTLYSTAISVASTETIQAVGAATGYNSSPVSSAPYTINAYSTPTYRTQCSNTESGSGTTSVTCTLTATAGDMQFVMCRGANNGIYYTASSNPTNGFHKLSGIIGGTGGSNASVAFGAASGSTVFTCKASATVTFQGITVLDYAPGSATTAFGVPNLTTASSSFTSAPITTTGPAFFIACGDAQYGPPTPTAGNINSVAATGRTMTSTIPSFCEELSSATAVTAATGTLTSTSSGIWDGVIVAFQ